jgi:hypothetical protein
MIEFLAQMPSDTMISITTTVLGFGGNADGAEMADLGGEFNLDQRRLRRRSLA